MSYTPTEWKSGDVITSENLNKLEQGVAAAGGGGGGVLVVNDNNGTLDKTWKEINDAYTLGTTVLISVFNGTAMFAVQVSGLNNGSYAIQIVGNAYFTNTEDGYPVVQG